MRLILLPGLGADHRCFSRQIEYFADNGLFDHITVPTWLPPRTTETLPEYARRMADEIQVQTAQEQSSQNSNRPSANNQSDDACVVVGLSFGGALAPFIAQKLNAKACVVMSMARNPKQFSKRLFPVFLVMKLLPWISYTVFRVGRLLLWLLLPLEHMILPKFYFAVLREVLVQDGFKMFLFLRMLLIWGYQRQEPHSFTPTTYVYGDQDFVIVPRYHSPDDIILPGAGHVLNYTFATTVNKIIADTVRKHISE